MIGTQGFAPPTFSGSSAGTSRHCAWPVLAATLMLLSACSKPASEAAAGKPEPVAKAEAAGAGVELKPEETARLGIVLTDARAAQYTPEKEGFGVVMSHEAIAQAVADVATAQAAAQQSRAAQARMQRLAGTNGADSATLYEGAQRQSAADAAALTLAQQKLSSILGQRPPWPSAGGGALLAELAAGRSKLLRATFPLGALNGAVPRSLRVSRLDPPKAGEYWKAAQVWDAPADAGIPGRSFFAVLPGNALGEGERLLVRAATSDAAAESGALIPASAAVLSDGEYWCYVERETGMFVRTPLDISRPMDEGYFIQGSIKPADRIVSAAAGLLLARETNPSTEAE